MERQLYPGIAFSPQTTLTENIGEADTIIKISDVSAFPEAPNLATIGIDEDGETILYTAKTEDALSGCQRGVEGTAKAWKAGEIIGRNFTAKDHNDLIASVKKIEEEKGKPSGTATLDENGTIPTEQRVLVDDLDQKKYALGVEGGKLYFVEVDSNE